MKIKMKTKGAFAIDCRTNINFEYNDILSVGDKNLTKDHLKRLIEIGVAIAIDNNDISNSDKKSSSAALKNSYISDIDNNDTSNLDKELSLMTDKNELKYYAKSKYNIDLDKRKTIDDMILELKRELTNGK